MSLYRISSRFPKAVLAHRLPNKVVSGHVSIQQHFDIHSPLLQQFGFSSSASLETDEKNKFDSENGQNDAAETSSNADVAEEAASTSDKDKLGSHTKLGYMMKRMKKWMYGTNTDLSGTDFEDLTIEDLIKLVTEKEQLLKVKNKEIENTKERVLRSYAEIENVMNRTRREAENSKNITIQSFAKGLLDVADNLERVSSVVKESFSKVDTSHDSGGAVPLLNTLFEGVEMTEKQLTEVLKKFGVKKYDPTGEQFDPNRHNAVFQLPDASKPSGTVAVVLKSGYVLHDRVIRPAEVGVTDAVEKTEAEEGSGA